MKNVLSILKVLCILFTIGSAAAYAAETDTALSITMEIGNPMMTVSDAQKEIDPGQGTAPVIIDGRTLVPIRAIVEELGGTVNWQESTQTVTLTYERNDIRLTIDNTSAYFNGEAYTLDAAPTIMNNRTMLPIRFISECFEFAVNWNPAGQLITITKSEHNDAASSDPVVEPQQEDTVATNETRALVVYFSATGNTKSLAEKIAEASGANLYDIVPVVSYTSEDLNYNNDNSRANQEINSDARPDIQPLSVDIEQYGVILLGYPIWWGQCPPPVLSFLESYDLSNKTIMPFCTSGGSGISGSLSKIRQLCPDSNVTAGFSGTASTTETEINAWLDNNGFFAAGSTN